MRCELNSICTYRKGKTKVAGLSPTTYISTENMLPNKGGIIASSSLPNCLTTQEFQTGDVLVSNIRPYFKKIWLAEYCGGCSNDVLVFTANKEIDPIFLYYVLADDTFFSFATATAKGTKMPRGDRTAIMQYLVPQYDLQTQKKIGAILRSLDDKIELNNKINENLERQARAIFYEWFISTPQKTDIVQTEFGMLPTSFVVAKIGDLPLIVTDYVANGSFATLKANVKVYQEPNYAYFIRNTDLKSGTFEVFVDEHSYNFLSKSRLFGGEIIISNVGDVGSVFLCPTLEAPMTLGNNIIMLKPEKENLRYYLYIWFKWSLGQGLMQGIKSGSAQPKFNKTDFKALPVILPPDKLLDKFHETVAPMFDLIGRNQSENRKLTTLRDALLPKLMSGELDVSNIQL